MLAFQPMGMIFIPKAVEGYVPPEPPVPAESDEFVIGAEAGGIIGGEQGEELGAERNAH